MRYLIAALVGVLMFFALAAFIGCKFAHATWKPEYGQQPQAVQDWFHAAEVPGGYKGPAYKRLGIVQCCESAERLKTKFLATADGDWAYFPDPDCTHAGCELLPIPADVVHDEPIRALNPKDDDLPQFWQMRAEGVLFIWQGKPTCFWPPYGGI